MSSRLWLFPALLILFASSGCRTPVSLCEEYFDERNAFEDACGLPFTERDEWCQDTARLHCGCGVVSTVSAPDELVQECFRFFRTQSESCDSPLLDRYPESMPSICETRGHFRSEF